MIPDEAELDAEPLSKQGQRLGGAFICLQSQSRDVSWTVNQFSIILNLEMIEESLSTGLR